MHISCAARFKGTIVLFAIVALCASAVVQAQFAPGTAHPALRSIVAAMPEGTWARVNQNLFSDVWTPADQRPLVFSHPGDTSTIINNWSGFAWDSGRGDLMLFGGGHQSYSGNEVYRWRSSTLKWERASLPSEVINVGPSSAVWNAIDGPDAGPPSAHTYDNNMYLPIIDRFMVLGGAAFNTGGNYQRLSESDPSTYRTTGPYLFDASKADQDKVGGSTGSHVMRVAPHPEVTGGHMWQNRDLTLNLGAANINMRHVAGCTAYNLEGGHDVVYIGAHPTSASVLSLYRYEIDDVDAPATDNLSQMGTWWYGSGGQTACSYDPLSKIFVRTNTDANPFSFWDIRNPGPTNRDKLVENTSSIAAFNSWLSANGKHVYNCGLDIDPVARQFALWCGGGSVWMLQSPVDNGTANWTITQLPSQGTQFPPEDIFAGVLGKWKYAPGYDVFVALEGRYSGNVWIYKPYGWAGTDTVDVPPEVSLTAPSNNSIYDKGASITLSANASDDVAVSKVEFFANDSRVGVVTVAPYTFGWTPALPGIYALEARATDNRDGAATSSTVSVTLNDPPTSRLTAPAQGAAFTVGDAITVTATASDSDGTVASVQFFANGGLIGARTAAPYSITWTPATTGPYDLTAAATDNRGSRTTSSTVSVNVNPANTPPVIDITSPSDGAQIVVNTAVMLTARASDPDGSVASVNFLVNGNSAGSDGSYPYSVSWTATTTGSFTITAVATDSRGAKTTSAPVKIDVVPAGGGTVAVLQRGLNGYTAMSDTMLANNAKTANYGTRQSLLQYYQQYVALLRFAIFASEGGPVPDGATIQSARLDVAYNAYAYTYELHAMKEAWSEAEATWNQPSAGLAWSVPGANGSGTDYESAADARASVGQQGGVIPFDVTARVRAIGSGASNFGWRILGIGGSEALRSLYSSEYATQTLRPKLTVTYSAP